MENKQYLPPERILTEEQKFALNFDSGIRPELDPDPPAEGELLGLKKEEK